MTTSILDDIKMMLGILPDYDYYNLQIIIYINTAFSILEQLGCKHFAINGVNDSWNDFFGEEESIEMIKTFVYLKVKMLFDPSASSSIQNSFDAVAKELEWRINSKVDYEKEETNETSEDEHDEF